MHILLVTFHVTCAAILFGLSLGLTGSCRRAMARGHEALRAAAEEVNRKGKILGGASVLTLLSGVSLIMSIGGFAAAPKNFHAAMGLMMVAMVISFGILKPAGESLVLATEGDSIKEDLANLSLKKMAMGSGILHLMWIGMLMLMFARF